MPPLSENALETLAVLTLVSPLLALLVAAIAWILRKAGIIMRIPLRLLAWVTRGLSAISLLCSLALAGADRTAPIEFDLWVIHFYLDSLSIYFLLIVNLVAFFASWYSHQFLEFDRDFSQHHEPETFHFFFNAFHLTMLVVPMVDNLVVLWMAIELTTLASTLLVRYRRQRRNLEAAWKYIIITTAGIVFALFGTILLTLAISETACTEMLRAGQESVIQCAQLSGAELMAWSLLSQQAVAAALEQHWVSLSFLFILIGYGAKAGLAPLHTWLPDGHGEAPSPVSALLSGVLLKSALYALLRFYTITNLSLEKCNHGVPCLLTPASISSILLVVGLLSLVLATPFILKRNKFKRVLAYHSLEHMGIIVFGIGIGGQVALFGALLHALNHALTKALMFLAFANVRRACAVATQTADPDEERISGVLKVMPITGSILFFGGAGLVGSPPFNLFLSELIILWAAFTQIGASNPGSGQPPTYIYAIAIALFIITVTIIFAGLIGHLGRLLLGRPSFNPAHERYQDIAPLLVLLFIVALFGVWLPTQPIDFPQLINQSVCIIQQGASGGCF